ncbi:protein of unknown function [Deinococcus reticulitermitis]|uniref:DNA primase/polymerase bifunctional N-terminal domain-containing protein n=1 Tax=Deinococcus reticulitermitis TaxID=856736 RepID=A0A1H6VP90_9DEIO|nr:bifunctional DNA primase/polymerase [Deinococcus reticulitermitis]SEJ06453.1 protein of unknown function [Deinococcus reticulitermitis]
MTADHMDRAWDAGEYAEHYTAQLGFGLVAMQLGQKGPRSDGWNEPSNALTDPELVRERFRGGRENMGLLHSVSGTAVVDVDSLEHITAALAAVGVNWPEIVAQNPWRIRGFKGEKPVFRLPEGLVLTRRSLAWPPVGGAPRLTVFELRAGSVQDVLPPSLHPLSRRPYTWVNGVPPSRESLPLLPEPLLQLWLTWTDALPRLQAACPWATQEQPEPTPPTAHRHDSGHSVIEAFNSRFTPGEVLERHGYRPRGKDSWVFPESSTGTAGVHTLHGSDTARVYSHHAADPLNTGHAHDAFSVFTHLEHNGDLKPAVKSAACELGLTQVTAAASSPQQSDLLYENRDGALYWNKRNREGVESVRLTNFTARIVAETTVDDGAERRSELCIEGRLADGRPLPRIQVPAEQYGSLNWITEKWGVRPIVSPGTSVRQHLAVALQVLSQESLQECTIYAHSGWRELPSGKVFITGSGALGIEGSVDGIAVDLPRELAAYALPAAMTGAALTQALSLSLNTWALASDTVTIPLYLSTLRPLLGSADFSVVVVGKTGLGKTQLAALLLAHFGAAITAQGLPGWHSTANYLERLAYLAKDLPLVIDDFNPTGSRNEQARYHATAERLLRAQGNQNGRGRLNNRAALRVAQEPRGLLIITAEDLPKGHSALARALVLRLTTSLTQGEASATLSQAQLQASEGTYAGVTAAFVQWLIPRLAELQSGKAAFVREHRSLFPAAHARTVTMAAELYWTWDVFERFAMEVAGLSPQMASTYRQRVLRTLRTVTTQQALHQEHADPTQRALMLLNAGLTTRAFHLEDASGEMPDHPEHFGWQRRMTSGSTNDYHPQGKCVGWLTATEVYLHPVQAYVELQRLADAEGEPFTTSRETLWRHFQEAGLLRAHDDKRHTVKRAVRNTRARVLVLSRTVLEGECTSGAGGASIPNDVQDIRFSAPTTSPFDLDPGPSAPPADRPGPMPHPDWGQADLVGDASIPPCPTCPTNASPRGFSYELD